MRRCRCGKPAESERSRLSRLPRRDASQCVRLPLPYVVYRGDTFRITREGAKAKLLEHDRLHVDLSVAASLPGRTSDDSPRKGMPDLLPTFEAGPSIDWWLTDRVPGDWNWRLRLPVRAVAGFNVTHSRRVGWLTHPYVQVDHTTKLGEWDFDTSASVGHRGRHAATTSISIKSIRST